MFSLGKTAKDNGGYSCDLCRATIGGLDEVLKTRVITDALEAIAEKICHSVMPRNITVCPGAVKEMGDIMVPVLTRFLVSPDYVCGRLIQACLDVEFVVLDHKSYVDRVL